ncbi:MAG: hypothetical protein A3I01_12440 [Betaproteobacteria bacterium RIFCSPLOWO2_02_FULL_65_24]|nr:MAG: hypothetical protein A3I01_12440 [Betaproteobacteria bacterium RIFCSPLOWO2_02_FULL_65_24]
MAGAAFTAAAVTLGSLTPLGTRLLLVVARRGRRCRFVGRGERLPVLQLTAALCFVLVFLAPTRFTALSAPIFAAWPARPPFLAPAVRPLLALPG